MADLNWFIRNRSMLCPKHVAPRPSLVKTTSWCPQCQKLWKLRRSQYSWRYQWWFINEGEKYLEKESVK